MNLPRKYKKNRQNKIAELYSANLDALWNTFRLQHISFWFLCFYYFIEYVRLQSTYPALDVLPWGQFALLVTLLTVFLDGSIKWVSNPINKLFILFCLIIVISGVFAFMPSASWNERNIMLSWFLAYFLTINIVNSEEKLILFLLAYFLFNLKMSQHGATAWASRGFSFAGWGLVGAPGWFRNSGEFAIQMLIFGSLIISYVYAMKGYWGRYKKWFFYVVAATGYMAVLGASSRGAQLALVGIGIWALLKQKWRIKGLISLMIIFSLLYLFLPDQQIERFREMGSDKDSLQRLVYWEYGLSKVIPKHPFLGVGYHNWLEYVSFMVPQGMGPYQTVQESHNIYIQAASELGIIGLLCFLLLIAFAFIVNTRTRKIAKKIDNRLLYYIPYGLDAGLIGYLIAGSFVTVLYYPFFWIQIAMIVMVNNVAKRELETNAVKNIRIANKKYTSQLNIKEI
jgi:O-antigen ligase